MPYSLKLHDSAWIRMHRIWSGMKQRCHNPKHCKYFNYGGRGITVCERWKGSFKDFLADMGMPPSARYSIERRDSDLGYSPDNCYWATTVEQNRHKRTNRQVTCGGVTRLLVEWCETLDIDYVTVRARLCSGWTPERALYTPGRKYRGTNIRSANYYAIPTQG